MPEVRKTVLCIDDHKPSLAGWCLYLQNAGYTVETAHSPDEGLQLFATQAIDLVLLDYAMPEVDGGKVAAMMKQIKPQVRIVMFSGVAEVPAQARAHVDAFLQKGQHPSVVLQAINELLQAGEPAA